MQAYLNDETLKQRVIAGLKAHYEADEIIKGVYWENGKGCAVGCILHDLDKDKDASMHARFETELGIPVVISKLIDRLFEGLPNTSAKEFPLKIMPLIETGSDLTKVWPKFAIWLLTDIDDGVIKFAKNNQQSDAIKNVAELFKRKINKELISVEDWNKAADAAAAYAANAAAAVAANAATYAAAYAANAAAAVANAANAANAAASAARQSHYEKMAEKLIELVKEAK